jgi:hypothetical protein
MANRNKIQREHIALAERELSKLGVSRFDLWRNNLGHPVIEFDIGGHRRRCVLSASGDPRARYATKTSLCRVAMGVAP